MKGIIISHIPTLKTTMTLKAQDLWIMDLSQRVIQLFTVTRNITTTTMEIAAVLRASPKDLHHQRNLYDYLYTGQQACSLSVLLHRHLQHKQTTYKAARNQQNEITKVKPHQHLLWFRSIRNLPSPHHGHHPGQNRVSQP
jgi:hypothetical protein